MVSICLASTGRISTKISARPVPPFLHVLLHSEGVFFQHQPTLMKLRSKPTSKCRTRQVTTEPHVDTTQAASQQGQPASKSETLQPERPPGCTPPRTENNAPRHRCGHLSPNATKCPMSLTLPLGDHKLVLAPFHLFCMFCYTLKVCFSNISQH